MSREREPRPVFVSATGGYSNIGDAVIRREALRWSRHEGPACVYVADAPNAWSEQLCLRSTDEVVARDRGRWLRSVIASRRALVVFEPGEVRLDRGSWIRELVFLMAVLVVRLRRGVVVIPPRAIVGGSRLTVRLAAITCRLANLAFWREESSLRSANAGVLIPDIAFGIERPAIRQSNDGRVSVVVTQRGDQDFPSDQWIQGIADWAEEKQVELVTIAQVREDEDRARAISERLGARHVPWSSSIVQQEQRLWELYGDAHMVISDRLHALIFASVSGAIPVELADVPRQKVQKHFDVVGIKGISAATGRMTHDEIKGFLHGQSKRAAEISRAVGQAREALENVEHELRELTCARSVSRNE